MSFLSKIFFGNEREPDAPKDSITIRPDNDGTIDISGFESSIPGGGINKVDMLIGKLPESERAAIQEYRSLAMNAEVDEAIQEIVNESFNITQDQKAISLEFQENSTLSAALQKKITEVYEYVYHDLFDFDSQGAYLFRKFYVDSRLFLHKVISKNKKSIIRLQVIDPLQIRRLKNTHADENGFVDLAKEDIMYVYVPEPKNIDKLWGLKSTAAMPNVAIAFPKQSIAYIDSGLVHPSEGYIIGHLSKAIIPYNNMKTMEDSMVIYRVVRSPARRVFYVDVSNMPKNKGEQYIRDTMHKFKNKMVYDSNTGAVADRRHVISMLEDIWLPRANGRSTEVSMLDEGSNVGETADVEYCRNTFYRSLNVPRSRFNDEANPFGTSRLTEISRDEYRFLKFIQSLRNRFSNLIEDVLRTELELRGVINQSEWQDIKRNIAWVYAEDNQFVEMKKNEILNGKINTLSQVDGHSDKYFSKKWIMQNIMQFSDAETETLLKQIEDEKEKENEHNEDFE